MNEIIQNRVLRGFLTLFVGVMLALSIGLMMQSIYPAPQTIVASWAVVTFLALFALGVGLAVASTVWQERLTVLSGGIFLAGVLAIADAALLNIAGLGALDPFGGNPTRFTAWLVVLYAFVASASLFALGWWRFHGEVKNRDGQRFYTILTALLPVWFVWVAVWRVTEKLHIIDRPAIVWYCFAFFVFAVVFLAVGMLFSRQLQLLGNVLSLSAVILAFASVMASFGLENFRTTALIALAATVVAMFVGYKAFSQRTERVQSVEVLRNASHSRDTSDVTADDVLVLYASGETPPSDAKLVEVPLGNGIVFRGFAVHRSSQPPKADEQRGARG